MKQSSQQRCKNMFIASTLEVRVLKESFVVGARSSYKLISKYLYARCNPSVQHGSVFLRLEALKDGEKKAKKHSQVVSNRALHIFFITTNKKFMLVR